LFTFLFDVGVFCLVAFLLAGIKIIKEYDRFVIFRFGKAIGTIGPGIVFVWPIADTYRKADLRIITAAVCFFQVVDPFKAVTKIEDPIEATRQIAQTTLRSVLGQHELDELLSARDSINAQLSAIIDRQTEGWGIKVNSVEVKDVEIPEGMQRAMARQAEAERERRAKVVAAEGEHQAAEKLAQAAQLISSQPGAMQLRQLQTMVEVSAEKNSTLIFPIPIEFMSGITSSAEDGERLDISASSKEVQREPR
jgi:regulator of protease activity HflC (stomatin/prohibitin superfamily)